MYYEVSEANINFANVGRVIRDELIDYGVAKICELVKGKLDMTGTCVTVTNPSIGSTQLMYHLVDNSIPYNEFAKTRERYDIDIRLSLDRNKNSSSKIANIVKTILN